MSAALKNLLPWMTKTPKKPTPVLPIPGITRAPPSKPTPVPGMPPYSGISAPSTGRNTLLGGG